MDSPLSIDEAARYLRLKRGHLAQLRYTGRGPAYVKPTPKTVLYYQADLDDWLANARQLTSA